MLSSGTTPQNSRGAKRKRDSVPHQVMSAFDSMPDRAKKTIYARMREVLEEFPTAERDAIVEILHDTKKTFS